MKKLLSLTLSLCMAITMLSSFTKETKAINFEGKERQYLSTCSSNTLSNAQIAECKEFNKWYSAKKVENSKTISGVEEKLDATQENIEKIIKEIEEYQALKQQADEDIQYFSGQINKLNADITYKEGILKERIYAMQGYVNSDFLLEFFFEAESLSDMYAKINGLNQISKADKKLVSELEEDKASMEQQKAVVENKKVEIQELIAASTQKQQQLTALEQQYQTQLESLYAKEKDYQANNDLLENAIASSVANQAAIEEARRKAEEERKKAEEEEKRRQELLQQQQQQNSGTSTPAPAPTPTPQPSNPNGSSVALAAVSAALSKVGCPYVWGGTGPNGFDCSGLMQWSYRQAGKSISRTTFTQCKEGTAVAWGQFKPGDLLFFETLSGAQPSHVVMYIGNGKIVHAGTVKTGVVVTDVFTSYWQSRFHSARRIA